MIEDINKVIELTPGNKRAYVFRSGYYREQGDYPEALASINEAIAQYPNHADYYNLRGTIYSAQEKYEEAITDYTQAITLDPHNPQYYDNRSLAYLKVDPQLALIDYNQKQILELTEKITLNPTDTDSRSEIFPSSRLRSFA